MNYPHNEPSFHVPQPIARPGKKADFSHLAISDSGSVAKPEIDAKAEDMRGHAYPLEGARVTAPRGKGQVSGTATGGQNDPYQDALPPDDSWADSEPSA